LPRGVNAKEFLREALKERVAFIPGGIFYPDNRGQDRIRLTFTSHPPAVIKEAVRGLGVALRRVERAGAEEPLEEAEAIRPIV
jgi:DNA-binding transcriptional MocR family regulator